MKLVAGNDDEIGKKIRGAVSVAEEKVALIERLMQSIARREFSEELLEVCPSVKKLCQENERLRYRCHILRQSIQEERKRCVELEMGSSSAPALNMDLEETSILSHLKCAFRVAIGTAFPELPEAPLLISEATKPQFGDYQCNSAMGISKQLGKIGKTISPKTVAEKIVALVPDSALIHKLEIAGPGFINIHLNREEISRQIARLLIEGVKPPKIAKKRVVIDFSSPNIAKEMHVGHLRSTIIGESISRLLGYVGFDVLRLNHIGDWGTQFGMLIAHLQDKFPNYLNETPPLSDLQAFYKESKIRFDSEDSFKSRAYDCVVKLQNFDADFVKAWQMICDVSRKDFEKIYQRLGVRLVERGESFYQDRMRAVVEELEEKCFLQNDEGRKVMFVTGKNVPLTVVKSDGGYTYDTSDLAALRQRLFEENADWILYVVDAGQALHLESIFAAGKQLGWFDASKNRIEHIAFGLVLGEDRKKFKTRSGDTVRLADLLDEGLKRSQAKLEEKGRDKVLTQDELKAAQEAVAYGCIKYADLSNNRTADYVFKFDRMLDDRGNTAVYLLYTYTRIRSIARNAQVDRNKLKEEVKSHCVDLSAAAEFKLAKTLMKFMDVILTVLDSLRLHVFCEYLYELSTVFTEFYSDCYCIEKDGKGNVKKIHMNRLALCEATADVMATCFSILGIDTVEKM